VSSSTNAPVREYWNVHIHDLDISPHQPGSPEFFRDLDEYHFEKLHHLLRIVDFAAYSGRRVLDVGCGAGVDLARFVKGGAHGVGLDLSGAAVRLARENFRQQKITGVFVEADGEKLPFAPGTFDVVYAHGVVQYTTDGATLVEECRRVLKPGGTAIFQVYNRISWLNALSKLMKVGLEHEDAPVLRKYSITEFRQLLSRFPNVRIIEERFPVKSRLHKGWKGGVYNSLFVGTFNALPRSWVRRYGWHLLAVCTKET
jgi:SAM-dependent methyltransferase